MTQNNPPALRAIPTHYAGVNMRSRLEARWAAFFDACKWPWSYEPLELVTAEACPGWKVECRANVGGYCMACNGQGTVARSRIPDFVLDLAHPLMVECKPASTLAELAPIAEQLRADAFAWLAVPIDSKRTRHLAEMIHYLDNTQGTATELDDIDFLVACALDCTRRAIVVGSTLHDNTLDGALKLVRCEDERYESHVGIVSTIEQATCMVCGEDNEHFDIPADVLRQVWAECGNAVQWNRKATEVICPTCGEPNVDLTHRLSCGQRA